MKRKKEAITAMIFLFPSFAGVLTFILLPFFDVIRRSFYEAMGGRAVGAENYKTVLESASFQNAAYNTGRFLGACIPLLLLLSLLLSLVLHGYGKATHNKLRFFKTSYLIPMSIPVASVVLLWKMMFHKNGFLNIALSWFDRAPVDFMNTNTAFYVLIFSYLWKNTGYDMILWLAGLDGISESLYEAASVDGAGKGAQFYYITMPHLKPVLFTTAVLSLVNSFKVFREAYLIGGDYPHDSIYMLQHIFNNWFINLDIQKMCAAAVMMAAVILVFILVFRLVMGREEEV